MDEDKGLEKLVVWNKALEFAVLVCREILPTLPEEEKFALTAQMRRSVQSIPSNLAEGHGRYYYQDTIRFCYIARGSLEETRSHFILANKLGYLRPDHFKHAETNINDIRRLLNGYIRYLRKSKRGENESTPAIKEGEFPYGLE